MKVRTGMKTQNLVDMRWMCWPLAIARPFNPFTFIYFHILVYAGLKQYLNPTLSQVKIFSAEGSCLLPEVLTFKQFAFRLWLSRSHRQPLCLHLCQLTVAGPSTWRQRDSFLPVFSWQENLLWFPSSSPERWWDKARWQLSLRKWWLTVLEGWCEQVNNSLKRK